MVDRETPWFGVGDTPEEALRDRLPDPEAEHVAWLDDTYLPPIAQDPAAHDDSIRKTVTVIYEERPAEDWSIGLIPCENHWESLMISRRKLHPPRG